MRVNFGAREIAMIYLLLNFFVLFMCMTTNSNKNYYPDTSNDYKYDNANYSRSEVSVSEIVLPPNLNYKVNKIFRRHRKLYTQGLFFEDDGNSFYESGGLYGVSSLNQYSFPNLELIKSIELDKKYFAEGIARCGDYIYQLTWQENDILQYQKSDFKLIGKIPMPSGMREGWGLAGYKNNLLIATDGTHNIFVLDCFGGLNIIDTIPVTIEKYGTAQNLNSLNDLIWAENYIFANRYYDRQIYKIDPMIKKVVKTYDLTPLINFELKQNTLSRDALQSGDVLNGIAYIPIKKNFLITGKHWGFYYEVELN